MNISHFLLYSDFFLFMIGLYILSWSPIVFKMDKNKNVCTKKKKHIWQKRYKIEPLCQLSDVKKADRNGKFGLRKLCLELKSGKNLVLFLIYEYRGYHFADDLDCKADEINLFLSNRKTQYVTKFPSSDIGWGCIMASLLFLLLFII